MELKGTFGTTPLPGSRETRKVRRQSREAPKTDYVEVDADAVLIAIGTTSSSELLTGSFKELSLDEKGYIEVYAEGHTNIPGVFAGGDIMGSATTVIEAAAQGKAAAASIESYLCTQQWPEAAALAEEPAKGAADYVFEDTTVEEKEEEKIDHLNVMDDYLDDKLETSFAKDAQG